MIKVLFLGYLALLLSGCGVSIDKIERTGSMEIVLTGFKPPKHTYISYIDKRTGKQHNDVYVSKYCHKYDHVKVGETYKINFYKVTWENGSTRTEPEFKETICKSPIAARKARHLYKGTEFEK